MHMTDSTSAGRFHLSLRGRLSLGYGSVLILFLLLGVVIAVQFNQVLVANAVLAQETQNALAAQELSRASLELVVAIDKGILMEDPQEFTGPVTQALARLETQYQIVRGTLTDTLPLDTSIASLTSVVRPMIIQAEGGTWSLIRDNRVSRIDDKIARLALALDEAVRVAQARQAQALERVYLAQQTVYLYTFGLFVLAALLGSYIVFSTVRSVTRSVNALTTAASRLAAGELEQRIQVRSLDELGRLAVAFNDMAEQLQSLYKSLERRVAERTADLQRRSIQLEAAARVAREAAAIHDVHQLLETTVHLVSQQFGFYHAGIFLLDETGTYAVLEAASSEGGQRMLARGHRLKVGQEGIVGYVSLIGAPYVVRDVETDAVHIRNPDLPDTRSEMAVPLRVRERVIGVLDVQSTEPAAFIAEDVATLQTLADQVALAIENARLLREAAERLREVNLLLGRSSLEGWEQWTATRPGWSYVYDGVRVTPQEAPGVSPTPAQFTVPLQVRDTTIGYLNVTLPDRSPTEEEIGLAREVAERAALALENARLYQDSQRRAARERLIGEVTARMRETLDIETVLQTAAQEVRLALGLPEVVVRLMPPGT